MGSPGGPAGAQLLWHFSPNSGATWAATLATVTLDEANQTIWGPWQPAALRQTIAAQLALFGQGGSGSEQVRILEVALDIRGVDQTSAARLAKTFSKRHLPEQRALRRRCPARAPLKERRHQT